jgi:hypothetical protein
MARGSDTPSAARRKKRVIYQKNAKFLKKYLTLNLDGVWY